MRSVPSREQGVASVCLEVCVCVDSSKQFSKVVSLMNEGEFITRQCLDDIPCHDHRCNSFDCASCPNICAEGVACWLMLFAQVF